MSARERVPTAAPAAAAKTAGVPVPKEIGWLPDCVYTGEKFESGLAFFADATGRLARFSREPTDLSVAKRLPGQAALPGLVNTHSHAWQRVLRGRFQLRSRPDRATAGDWQEAHDHALDRLSAEDVYDASRMAFLEMILSGITAVGESHFLHHQPDGAPVAEPNAVAREILRAAHDVGIRIALLNGAWMRADFRQRIGSGPTRCLTAGADQFIRETDALRDHVEKNFAGDEAWIGVAPQNLGAVPIDHLKTIANYAHAKRLRLHLQIGELENENAACIAEYARSPAALLSEQGLLDKRFTAVHGAHLTDEDIRILGAARVTICACPAAEYHFNGGGFRMDKVAAAGSTLAVGTDGQLEANLFENVRLLEFQLRHQDRRSASMPSTVTTPLFQAATVAGARSLGAPGGALEIGRPADFFTVDLYDPSLAGAAPESLLDAIVFASTPRAVREVWIGARQRVGRWRHSLQSTIIERFVNLEKRLWAT